MKQQRTSWRRLATILVSVVGTIVALVGPVGAPAQAADRLTIGRVEVTCECGGAGYSWGWRGIWVPFEGARARHTYKVAVKGGPTVKADAYGTSGSAFIDRTSGGFQPGRTYRFRVKEFRGRRLVRTSAVKRYTVPRPVAHPRRAHIDTLTHDGEEVMVAGQTYQVTFDGTWGDSVRFASGVDRYQGDAEAGDDRFGYYQQDGYPLPWSSSSARPITELTPTEEFVGTTWHIVVVGYRPAPEADPRRGLEKGDPVPGSEWGYEFTVRVVAPEDVAQDG